MGQKKYEYSAWFTDATFDGLFYGLMLNNHYSLKLSKRLTLRFEAGGGMRFIAGDKNEVSYDNNIWQPIESVQKIQQWSTILNLSVGMHYRF